MANKTRIEWTEVTWNPVTGCTPVSPGCDNCYARRMAHRLQAMRNPAYKDGFKPTIHRERFDEPLHWKKPRMVFVCSMGDLFHSDIKAADIEQIISVMKMTPQHTYQILTKRSSRLRLWEYGWLELPENVWIGVSIETKKQIFRRNDLQYVKAPIRFISFEPLLGPIDLESLTGIDWVIVGGETGPGARPMKPEWVRAIRDQCIDKGVPFFFKRWGGSYSQARNRELDGRVWNEIPEVPGES